MITEKDVKRFWKHIEKTESCWMWTGWGWTNEYGGMTFVVNGKRARQKAHRVSWQIFHGDIPVGMMVCHKCDVPRCVNPDHLFLGTALDNNADKARKGRSYRGGAHNPARGDANGSRKYPERLLRGDAWRELHKELRHGENNGRAKLNADDVAEIRRSLASGSTLISLARKFGVTPTTISSIRDGRLWKHIP